MVGTTLPGTVGPAESTAGPGASDATVGLPEISVPVHAVKASGAADAATAKIKQRRALGTVMLFDTCLVLRPLVPLRAGGLPVQAQAVSHAQAHNSPNRSLAWEASASRSSSAECRTASTVEPEPDINAPATPGCASSQVFNSASKRYFSNTGRSKSLTSVPHPKVCSSYRTPGRGRASRQR